MRSVRLFLLFHINYYLSGLPIYAIMPRQPTSMYLVYPSFSTFETPCYPDFRSISNSVTVFLSPCVFFIFIPMALNIS